MTNENASPVISDPTIRRHVRNTGIVLTIIGLAGIILPQFFTLAVELLLAWLLIFAGAAGLLIGWQGRNFLGSWHTAITHLLTLILGIVFLVYPFSGIATMTIFVVGLFTLQGLASIFLGVRIRAWGVGSWFWMLLGGISSLLVAGLILTGWPGTAASAIGLLIGFNLLFTGICLFSVASKVTGAEM